MVRAVGDRRLNLVRAAVGREVLREAVRALGRAGIPVAPLKGVLLHALVYERPEERPITDVDVLVPEHRFDDARLCLVASGWAWQPLHASEAGATHPTLGLPVDVHRHLFLPGAFALSTEDVFARARVDTSTFGVEVRLPDPNDLFAHLVGHFVKSRAGADDAVTLGDFERVGRAFALDAAACARHLEHVGMARAARLALGIAARRAPDGFASAVLGCLPPDRVGASLAWAARVSIEWIPLGMALGAWPGFALERSLPRAGLVLARHALASGHRHRR